MKKLDNTEIDKAIDVLFKAFYNDIYFNFVFETDENKNKYMKYMLEGWVKYCLMYGEVWYEVVDEDFTGVLGFIKPENCEWTDEKVDKSGMAETETYIPQEFKDRRQQYSNAFKLVDSKVPDFHIYFFFVAVDPKFQGNGIGKILINKILDYSKEVKAPIFLDTEEEKNVEWYLRLGFKKLIDENTTQSPSPMWFMLR